MAAYQEIDMKHTAKNLGRILARKAMAWLGAGLILGSLFAPGLAQSANTIIAGPYTLTLPSTKLISYSTGFSAVSGTTNLLRVQLSAPNSLTALSVNLNGSTVMQLADFAGGVTLVDRLATLAASNILALKLSGKKGTKITFTIYSVEMPKPTALSPSLLALNVGTAGQLSATLTPTPTTSGTLSVTSGNSAVATAPSSVTFVAGQGTVIVPIMAVAPGSAIITVSANGGQASATINVNTNANSPPSVSITTPSNNSNFAAPANITVTANAADTDGTIAKVDFYQGITLIGTATAAPYSVTWNNVAAGSYSLTAKATDNLGATTTSAAVAVISNAAPTVSITTPTNNSNFVAPANITVTANAADTDGTIAKVDFYNGATLIGTATAAPYSVTISNLAAVSYSLTAKATDNLGAITTSAAVVVISNAAPTVSITAPAANSNFTAPANITITANAADSDGTVEKVDFYQGTTLIGTSTAAPYSVFWSSVVAGSYSITAVATDNLGATRTSAAAAVSVLTNAAPTVNITAPVTNSSFLAPANIIVTANAADTDGTITKVDFYNGATLIGTATAAPYSVTLSNLAAGSYNLTAVATDNSGATTTSVVVAIISNAAPTVSITAPTNNSTFTAPANITVTANAADTDGTIARVDFYNGATLIGTATAAPYSVTLSNLATGNYSLTAVATDNLGATTTSAAVTVISNAAPTVSIATPVTNSNFNAPANITITANAADSDGTIARVDFYQGTTLIGTATTAPYSVTWSNVVSGNYSITAVATDNLGATTTSAAVAVNVLANAAPTVNITAPAANSSFTAPANITVTANATDTDGTIAKVDFYQGTTLIGTATTAPYSVTWSNVASGSYSITAVATDNLGAATTSAPVAVISNAAPTVNITAPAANSSFTALSNITITANAADSDGTISKVDFYQGTTLFGTATAAPYSVTWNNVAAGSYSLTAKATDNLGATTTSAAINVISNVAPAVSITTPAANSNFAAQSNITISANAADVDGTISKVDFYQGSTLIGTATAAPYSVIWNNVASGSYSLTAVATDNLGATTTSVAVNIVSNAAPTVSITAPVANSNFTAPANITVTVNAADTDGTIAKVEFYNGTTLIGTTTTAPYSITWSNVAAGSYSLTAIATDNNGASTTSAAVNVTSNAAPTVNITAPAANSNFIAPANITVTANAADSDGTIAKVDFYQGTTLIGTATTAPYSVTWNNVVAGSYSLTAVATDNLGATTTSAAVAIISNAAPTVSITAPAANSNFAAPANITVTANAADIDGTIAKVDFYNGTTLIGTVTSAPYSVTWNNVVAGNYSLTAVATDNLGAATTSTAVTLAVSKPATSTTLTTTPTISVSGQAVTLTATVTGISPSGTVTFQDGATVLGTATLAAGTATLNYNFVTVGDHSLTAVYGGDAGNAASTSTAVTQTITIATSTTTLIASPNPSAAGQAVTLTATVAGVLPNGTVTFMDGATVLGTASIGAGHATLNYTFNTVGTYNLSAEYSGDGNNTPSTSVVVTQTVKNASTTSLSATPVAALSGQLVTLTATVTGTVPGGTVTFNDGATVLGTAPLAAGQATFSQAFSTAGVHNLTASYGGDTNNLGSLSAPVSVTVAADNITYYHNDIAGTPLLATDASGNVVWKENYRPYGEKLNNPANPNNNIWYAGKPYDPNTGLSYMGARYYDPVMGRFTGIDPKGFDEADIHSFNRYAYANNNPYKFVDPDGRASLWIVVIPVMIATALFVNHAKDIMDAKIKTGEDTVNLVNSNRTSKDLGNQANKIQENQKSEFQEIGKIVKEGAELEKMVINGVIVDPNKAKITEQLPKVVKETIKVIDKVNKANDTLGKLP